MQNSGSFRDQKYGMNRSDNSDDNFIRFNQTPPSGNSFSPDYKSTPVRNRRGNNNWRGRNHYNNYSQNDSGNSPNYSRGGHQNSYRKNRPSFNKSRDDVDISCYYSHEMIEDPWLELEEKQRNDEIRDAKFDEDNKSTTSESSSNNSDVSSTKSGDEM
ncbi:homeobox protein 2-like [Chrysoperla carnea]|uniref:homeobox protein 2-like n=1 Tax=Chrysoperla carnea TaxID=189513 RepID=UPI001D060847|nr:homeobox protein 2-like [Chrysoperla carnea]